MQMSGVLRLTMTAIFIALLIAVQAAAAPLGQFVVGPLVNLILIVSVMTCGFVPGLTAAVLSNVFAKLLGIGPLWMIVPFVMAGNAALVLVWHAVGSLTFGGYQGKAKQIARAAALVLGAACKFAVLYIGVARIAVPLLLRLPEPQASVVSNMFSLPQLFTALMGGALAMAVLPAVERIRKGRSSD